LPPNADGIFENRLIQGDNLLALKALEQEFAGRVKCIYIDPPFNTQQAIGDHYDDGLEHSIWLTLMRDRLEALHSLLAVDGTLFIHIDDNELGYLMALADEVFGRGNRAYVVTFRQASATGHKSINPGCVKTTNFILIYCKDKSQWAPKRVYTARGRDTRYGQFISNKDADYRSWTVVPLMQGFADARGLTVRDARAAVKANPAILDQFVLDNAESVIRWARPDYDAVGKDAKALIDASEADPSSWHHLARNDHPDFYVRGGQRALFYSGKLKSVDGKYVSGEPLTTLWDDLLSNNLHNEGGVAFPKGKKPEALLKRCIELSTSQGDLVLDSFAGSGTTGAVAHKMRRRWIMIEQGEQAVSVVAPRIARVVEGRDDSGVTAACEWKGGGGFRFYRLAPSLIDEDKFGQKVISRLYNPEMLAEAMCKHMGFIYAPNPDPALFWQQGYASERDFIYTTTQSLTYDTLNAISADVGPDRTLLVCCKAFRARLADFPNLTVKKIPQAVLNNCEWGIDDYSLKIAGPAESTHADDKEPGGEGGENGSDNGAPTSRSHSRRSEPNAAPLTEARALPAKRAPLKMDGTTRKPRRAKVTVVEAFPPAAPEKVALPLASGRRSGVKVVQETRVEFAPAPPASPASRVRSTKKGSSRSVPVPTAKAKKAKKAAKTKKAAKQAKGAKGKDTKPMGRKRAFAKALKATTSRKAKKKHAADERQGELW
jgi:adenine-specific DNA-methyltransferase